MQARLCPTCHKGKLGLRLGKFGQIILRMFSHDPDCKYTKPLDGQQEVTSPIEEPVLVGVDPESGANITVRRGPYGHYLQWELPSNLLRRFKNTPKQANRKKSKRSSQNALVCNRV